MDIEQETDSEPLHTSLPSSSPTERARSAIGVIVGIPTYNEELSIGSVVIQVYSYGEEVIVVDDGSQDRTVQIAEAAGATVVPHSENKGKGDAIQTLFREASEREMEALILLDGDGQHVPTDIPTVAGPVLDGDADLVIGSRYKDGNDTETPRYRRIGQRVLDFLTVGSSGKNLTDTQSGFRALSPRAVEHIDIEADGMGVESDMIEKATRKGLQVKEVSIDVRYEDVDGQTQEPLSHGLSVVGFILRMIRDRHPLMFFGIPGGIAVLIGIVLGLHTAWIYQNTGTVHHWRGMISFVSVLLGTLSMFCGIVLSRIQHMVENINE